MLAPEMVQQVKVLTIMPDNLSSAPGPTRPKDRPDPQSWDLQQAAVHLGT